MGLQSRARSQEVGNLLAEAARLISDTPRPTVRALTNALVMVLAHLELGRRIEPQVRRTAARFIASRGFLGLGESVGLGFVDVKDLDLVLYRLARSIALASRMPGFTTLSAWIRGSTEESRGGSSEQVTADLAWHYDMEPRFFETFLDKSMTYSSAIFSSSGDDDLYEAQSRKIDALLAYVGPLGGARILDVGCGWGSIAERANALGANVVGLSASDEQIEYCKRRRSRAISFVRAEFREFSAAPFDGVVCCEMIEGVGLNNLEEFMRWISGMLKVEGHVAFQAILTRDTRMRISTHETFISRYIFPGGQILSFNAICDSASRAGLELTASRDIREDYVRTLERWRQNWRCSQAELEEMGISLSFSRLWDFYLSMCIAGFKSGDMSCAQLAFVKV